MTSNKIPQRLSRRWTTAVAAAVVACAVGALGAAPAHAGDARCTADRLQVDCGVIYNTSGVSVRIATNFSPTYSAEVGTVSGVTATLGGTQNSNVFKDSSGRYYDWDAVYIPPKSCLFMKVGPGFGSDIGYNNTRTYGVWYKVNNLGAQVRGLRSC